MDNYPDGGMAAPAKKRKTAEYYDDDDDAGAAGDDGSSPAIDHNNKSSNKKNNRNERKRQLEKKRRDEVNSGLDKLMDLLFEIDPKSRAESRERQMGTGGGNEPADSSKYNSLQALNRVDLIHRSTELLRTLHYENQDLKKLLAELPGGGGVGGLQRQRHQAKAARNNVDLMIAPPPLQMPRMAAHASLGDPAGNILGQQNNSTGGSSSLQNCFEQQVGGDSATPLAVLNALRDQRQALIDQQRSIDASLELIRSGRLNHLQQPPSVAFAGPRREVSLDSSSLAVTQRQAAAARREEEMRVAQFTSALGSGGNSSGGNSSGGFDSHRESAHVLASLRKNRDDLLEEGSEQSGNGSREDMTLAALRQQASSSNPFMPSSRNHHQGGGGGGVGPDLSSEELLARLRNSRELLLSSGLGGAAARRLGLVTSLDPSSLAAATLSGQERFLQFQQDNQRLAERLAMEAQMPDSLARSHTLDPALLLRHHHASVLGDGGGGSGSNSGTGQRHMY